MTNYTDKFKELTEHIETGFGASVLQLKEKYKHCCLCLREYIKDGVHSYAIEVNFAGMEAFAVYFMNKEGICVDAILSMDRKEDDEAFKKYLVMEAYYNLATHVWRVGNFNLIVQKSKEGVDYYCFG